MMSEEKPLDMPEQARSAIVDDLRMVLSELAKARESVRAQDGDMFHGAKKKILMHAYTFDIISEQEFVECRINVKDADQKSPVDYHLLVSKVHKKILEKLEKLELEGRVRD